MLRLLASLLIIFISNSCFAISKEEALRVRSDDHTMGNKGASVVMFEFSSVSCPHCADFHKNVFKQVKENYIDTGKVLYVYRSVPTNHPGLLGIMLMSCAKSDRYFDLLNTLMTSQGMWAYHSNYKDSLINIAKLAGMQDDEINKCFTNQKLEDGILKAAMDDSAALTIDHTPTFFINGEKKVGASTYKEMQDVLDAAIAKAATKK